MFSLLTLSRKESEPKKAKGSVITKFPVGTRVPPNTKLEEEVRLLLSESKRRTTELEKKFYGY